MDYSFDVAPVGPAAVCDQHSDDASLVSWIRVNATETACSFCGRQSASAIAADLDLFTEHVYTSLQLEYGGADDEAIPWDSREGGYQAPTLDAMDILIEEGVTHHDGLLTTVANAWTGQVWVRRDVWLLSPDEVLAYGWARFRELATEGPLAIERDRGDPDEPQLPDAGRVLDMVGRAIEQAALVRNVTPGTTVFRAHGHEPGVSLRGADRLGAAPPPVASANRMSPAGVSMFYGAEDAPTAATESRNAESDPAKTATTVATFQTTQTLRLVDLADPPEIPGLFEEGRAHLRPAIRFLEGFADDISRRLAPDEGKHHEYRATQLLTNWLQTTIALRLDGLRYRSAQHDGGVCVVLFAGHGTAAEPGEAPRPEQVLQLLSPGSV